MMMQGCHIVAMTCSKLMVNLFNSPQMSTSLGVKTYKHIHCSHLQLIMESRWIAIIVLFFYNGLDITLIPWASQLTLVTPPAVRRAAVSSRSGSNRRTPSCLTVTVCVSERIYVDSVCSGQAAFMTAQHGFQTVSHCLDYGLLHLDLCWWPGRLRRGGGAAKKQQIDLL